MAVSPTAQSCTPSDGPLDIQLIARAIARGELPADTTCGWRWKSCWPPAHAALLTRDPIDPALPGRLVNAVLGTPPD